MKRIGKSWKDFKSRMVVKVFEGKDMCEKARLKKKEGEGYCFPKASTEEVFEKWAYQVYVVPKGNKNISMDSMMHWHENLKCPQQRGGTECGYYVMRYMFDLVSRYCRTGETNWAKLINRFYRTKKHFYFNANFKIFKDAGWRNGASCNQKILRKQLEREQEVIKAWKSSRDVQGIESFCEEDWKKSKKKLDSSLVEGLSTDVDSTDNEDYPSKDKKVYPSKDKEPHLSSERKIVRKVKIAKLNEKYGSVSKNFVTGETSQVKENKRANVGHLSIKQLNDRVEKIEVKAESKRKNNRNGKVGITKHNNYTLDKYAPRKIYVKCGNVNHLSVKCKYAMHAPMSAPPSSMPMNVMPAQNLNAQFANMPFA
ncbi:hypothetical protein AgCh_038954 [Apium graveolens]